MGGYTEKDAGSSDLRTDESDSSDNQCDEIIAHDNFCSRGKREKANRKLIRILKSTVHNGLWEKEVLWEDIVEIALSKVAALEKKDTTVGSDRSTDLEVTDLICGCDVGPEAGQEFNSVQSQVQLLRGKSYNGMQHGVSADRVSLYSNPKYHTTPVNGRIRPATGANSAILNASVDDCVSLTLSAEFHMDNGAAAFFPPDADKNKALKHWRRALETVDRACAPILKAKVLSNISCALSAFDYEDDALLLTKAAWVLTLNYLRHVPYNSGSYWTDFIRSNLKIDSRCDSRLGLFVCKVDAGALKGNASVVTTPDKHTDGASIVAWVLQMAINMGNRYYKLNRVEKAAKYYILSKILSESIIGDILSSCKPKKSTKFESLSSCLFHKPLLHQINPVIRSLQRLQIKQGSAESARHRNTQYSASSSSAQPSSDLRANVKLNYVLFQALLCNAKALSYLGVCYSAIPQLKSKSLSLHLEAESRIMRLLSLVSIELSGDLPESPPFALIESKLTCFCILLNLSLAYKSENKKSLAAIYRDLCIRTYQDYTQLLASFFSPPKVRPSRMQINTTRA